MNRTNSANISVRTPTELSIESLASTFGPSVVVCFLSAMAVITNPLIMLTIVKTKDLHNKSQYVIFSHALAEALYACFTCIHQLRRIMLVVLGRADLINELTCALILQGFIITSRVANWAILMLCLDRLLAIGAPVAYKRIGLVKYIIGMNLMCWGTVLALTPIGFIGLETNATLLTCNYVLAFPLAYRTMESTINQVLIVVTLVAYALAIWIVSYKYWFRRWTTDAERTNWSREIRMSAFRMMMAIGCIYLASWGFAQLMTIIVRYTSSPATQVIYGSYSAALYMLNTCSHFFVYYGFSKTFRKAFKKVIRVGPNSVGDVANAPRVVVT